MRLTKEMRRQIVQILIDRAFGAQEKELEAHHNAWTQSVKDYLLPADLLEKMKAMPEGSFPSDDDLRIFVNGDTIYVNFKEPFEMPFYLRSGGAKKIAPDHPIAKERHFIEMLTKNLEEQRMEAQHETWAALNAVTTSDALIKAWPAIEPFVRSVIGESQSKALAIPIPLLNKKLGLGDNPLPQPKPLKMDRAKRKRK